MHLALDYSLLIHEDREGLQEIEIVHTPTGDKSGPWPWSAPLLWPHNDFIILALPEFCAHYYEHLGLAPLTAYVFQGTTQAEGRGTSGPIHLTSKAFPTLEDIPTFHTDLP